MASKKDIIKWTSKLGGRRFLLIVISALVCIADSAFGIQIPEDVLTKLADMVLLFIGAESAVDVASAVTKNK